MIAPLDGVRWVLFRALAPVLGPWIRSREVRVALHGLSVVGLALLLVLVAPLWLLLVSPLVLGVPHLVADVRYLVAQPGLHRRGAGVWLVGGLLLAGAVAADLRWGLVAAALAPLVGRGRGWRRAAAGLGSGSLAAVAIVALPSTNVALAHAHNLVAVVLWLGVAVSLDRVSGRGGAWARGLPVVAAFGGVAWLASGAADGGLGWAFAGSGASLGLAEHARQLAPGFPEPLASRIVAVFAFAQAVHYGLWLRVIPEEARDRPSPRTWRASWRALRADLGSPLLTGSLLVFTGLALWAALDVAAARAGYLRLALFHGPMELAVLGAWAAEGREFWAPGRRR